MSLTQVSLQKQRGRRCNFSILRLMFATLLVATFCAGWRSHKLFHNRNLKENIAAAMQEIEGKNVQVVTIQDLGVTVIKGKEQNVNEAREIIEQVQAAASK
jgi:hypothetical protein